MSRQQAGARSYRRRRLTRPAVPRLSVQPQCTELPRGRYSKTSPRKPLLSGRRSCTRRRVQALPDAFSSPVIIRAIFDASESWRCSRLPTWPRPCTQRQLHTSHREQPGVPAAERPGCTDAAHRAQLRAAMTPAARSMRARPRPAPTRST